MRVDTRCLTVRPPRGRVRVRAAALPRVFSFGLPQKRPPAFCCNEVRVTRGLEQAGGPAGGAAVLCLARRALLTPCALQTKRAEVELATLILSSFSPPRFLCLLVLSPTSGSPGCSFSWVSRALARPGSAPDPRQS